MQVKKFEAKSMQEALKLVKAHLGPDAIILSAKDNSRSFGLAGSRSIEVTAAVSEETLRKKRIAESKLNEKIRGQYVDSSARIQKAFIEKATRPVEESSENVRRAPTATPYIDIDNEAAQTAVMPPTRNAAEERIKEAARRAWQAGQITVDKPVQTIPARVAEAVVEKTGPEIGALKSEIERLRSIIEGFNKVPQTFMTLHPGAEDGLSFELSASYQKLLKAGVEKDFAVEILKKAETTLSKDQLKKTALIDAWIAKFILDYVRVAENRMSARYHVFVGGAGQGKTSALVKMASHYVICEKKKVALITTDSTRVGAAEQLRIYAQILNVPFAIVRRKEDWALIESKLAGIDHILVDMPGWNLKSIGEVDQVRDLMPTERMGRRVHFLQSAMAKDEEAFDTAKRYQMIGFDDVIFTHLDGTGTHGCILNFLRRFSTPLHSFSIGAQIPEDFEPATKERVVDLIFKISKLKKREDTHD